MLNSNQNLQVSDTTDDDSNSKAGNKKHAETKFYFSSFGTRNN